MKVEDQQLDKSVELSSLPIDADGKQRITESNPEDRQFKKAYKSPKLTSYVNIKKLPPPCEYDSRLDVFPTTI